MFRLASAVAATIAAVFPIPIVSAMEPAPLKLPPVGTRLHYDEGGKPVSWKIVESKPGAYAAERSDGLSSYANAGGILAPAFRYRDERGFDGTQRLVSGDPMAIYPIAVGKSAKFTVAGEAPARGWKWTHDTSCSVIGTEKIKVPIGEFETFVVHCERRGNRGKEFTTTRYYAPSLGVAVRSITIDHVNNNRWSSDLVKFEAP